MRATTLAQLAILGAALAGGIYMVVYIADGWADWVVFGGILFASYGVVVAYHHRRYPASTKKRSFTRSSESRW